MTDKKQKKVDVKGLLDRKLSELSDDEIKALTKPIGTSQMPFPMYGTLTVEAGGSQELEQHLTAIAGDVPTKALSILSERDYAEVITLALSDMPVPSMLKMFEDALEQRKPDSVRRIQLLVGDPGAGKSYMSAMIARMQRDEPAEVLDCGGKNMRELLFEMVLDFGAGEQLPKTIDKKNKAGALDPMSVGLLRQLGDIEKGKYVKELDDGKFEIDWEGLSKSGTQNVENAYEILSKVAHVEGIDNGGGNALGMNSQYGPLITSFMKGDPLVLDEYNKSKEGTDDNLQTVLQFANGELAECTVENPLKNKDASSGPSHFTFRREDMKPGWFLTLTGNASIDGVTTRELNKSVYSRIEPQVIPEPTLMDWQHRICQIMVGIPVSTLYKTFREQADEDPKAFGEFLMDLRRQKAELIEHAPIPPMQETLLQNWENVNAASEYLAKCYMGWKDLVNPNVGPMAHPELHEDGIDEEYASQVSIDFRKVIQHIEFATPLRPEQSDVGVKHKFNKKFLSEQPEFDERPDEDLALNFGKRLTDLISRKMYETSGARGKPNLYRELKRLMKESGLKELHLQEAARSNRKSVEELLSISVFDDKNPSKQAELAQKLLCDYLRETDDRIAATDNEKIVTLTKVKQALDTLRETDTSETHELTVPNLDHETLSSQPFVAAEILDTADESRVDELDSKSLDDLVTHDDLIATLAVPVIGEKNLDAVWETNLSAYLKQEQQSTASAEDGADPANDDLGPMEEDEGMNIAENRSSTGIATTTLVVKKVKDGQAEDLSVHIVRNNDRGKTLVVSGEVSPRIEAIFKEAGITHVNRDEPNAASRVESALNDILRGTPEKTKERLKFAFLLRNLDEENEKAGISSEANLSELMVNKEIGTNAPKYVFKK